MERECLFCRKNIKEINFKDTVLISKFISSLGKIRPRKKTGNCSTHQRRLAQAIKRARFLGLLGYTSK